MKNNVNKKELIMNLIRGKEEGTLLSYDELNSIIEEDLTDEYGKLRFKSTMSRAKKALIEEGIAIKSVPYKGWYILKSNQIANYTYRTYIVKPTKAIERGKILLENVKNNKLNKDELKEKDSVLDTATKITDFTKDLFKGE